MCGERALRASSSIRSFSAGRIGFSDCLANLQLEHLSFAEPDSEQVARIAQDAKQKADFFIDALRSGAFTEARILVVNDGSLVEIDKHLAAKKSLQMIDCIFGKDAQTEAGATCRHQNTRRPCR